MINTNGGRFGGYGLYLLQGKPAFTWNLLDLKRVKWAGSDVLGAGHHTLEFDFKYDGLGFATLAFNNISGIGKGGTGTFKVDGKVVSTQTLTTPSRCCCLGMRRSISAATLVLPWTIRIIRFRSTSRARSTS